MKLINKFDILIELLLILSLLNVTSSSSIITNVLETVEWHPTENKIVTSGYNVDGQEKITIWNPDNGEKINELDYSTNRNGFPTWNFDGSRIFLINSTQVVILNENYELIISNITHGFTHEWSPMDNRIAIGYQNFTIIWDTNTNIIQSYDNENDSNNINSVTWNNDGDEILAQTSPSGIYIGYK